MNKKKLIIFLIVLASILFIVSIIILLNTNSFKLKNEISKEDKNQSNEVIGNKDNKEKINNSVDEIKENDNTNNGNDLSNKQEIIDEDDVVEKEEDNNENDVINYFSLKEKEIINNEEDVSLREKAKDTFISIVDFIFYDKEIKGYTFNELTTSAKLKIIKIALTIDSKIDEYFPNYKDTIKDKYTSIKGKMAVKYLEVTSTLCEKVGEDTCNQAKDDFNTMKESFGFTWDLIKELASSGSTEIKKFYESWRDSE